MAILDVTPQKHFLGFHTGRAAARDPNDLTSRRYCILKEWMWMRQERERATTAIRRRGKFLFLFFLALHVLYVCAIRTGACVSAMQGREMREEIFLSTRMID